MPPDAAGGRLGPVRPETFRAALRRLTREGAHTDRFAAAVSGGTDSLALLLLAAEVLPGRVAVLTVDHKLRPGSGAEADFVASVAASRGLPHLRLDWIDRDDRGGSLQARARTARYRLMRDWCAGAGVSWLMTAHQADDQAETLLLRLARGAGLSGLAGVRRSRPLGRGVTLIRPLLDLRRARLAASCEEAGLVPIRDPSNADDRFDRTRARALLSQAAWLRPERMAAVAANLAEAEAALVWAAERAWAGGASLRDGGVRLDVGGLPDEIVRRLVLRALATVRRPEDAPGPESGAPPGSGPEVIGLIRLLRAGRTATLAGVIARGGPVWWFEPETGRRPHLSDQWAP